MVGEDVSWSDNLIKALGSISKEYVLLFIDDLFLCDTVQTAGLKEVLRWVCRDKPNCVMLDADPMRRSYGFKWHPNAYGAWFSSGRGNRSRQIGLTFKKGVWLNHEKGFAHWSRRIDRLRSGQVFCGKRL
jgi:hypothetical protein